MQILPYDHKVALFRLKYFISLHRFVRLPQAYLECGDTPAVIQTATEMASCES